MSVSEIVTTLAPAFATDSRLSSFITIASGRTSRCAFGDHYELAVALRTCHMMAKNPSTSPGNTGAESSRTEGEMSQSFVVSPDLLKRYGDLATTPYGAELCELMDSTITGHIVPGFLVSSMLANNQGNYL